MSCCRLGLSGMGMQLAGYKNSVLAAECSSGDAFPSVDGGKRDDYFLVMARDPRIGV
jgi:hypothetical protein